MKKILLFIAFLLLASILFVLIAEPETLLQKLGPQPGDIVYLEADAAGEKAREEVALTVNNRLFPIHVDSLFLEMELEGEKVFESVRKKDIRIGAFAEDTLNLSASLRHKEIYRILKEANEQSRDSLQTTAKGTLYYNFPLLGKTKIPFDKKIKIRTPQLPEVKLADVEVKEVRLPEVKLQTALEVINHDSVEFTIQKLDYDLQIGGDVIVTEGTMGEPTKVGKRDTALIGIPDLSLKISDNPLAQIIQEGTDWSYSLNANMTLRVDRELFKTLIMDLQAKDTVDIVNKAQEALDE